jgi:hypothetical protein
MGDRPSWEEIPFKYKITVAVIAGQEEVVVAVVVEVAVSQVKINLPA